jgi:hypothetical protein
MLILQPIKAVLPLGGASPIQDTAEAMFYRDVVCQLRKIPASERNINTWFETRPPTLSSMFKQLGEMAADYKTYLMDTHNYDESRKIEESREAFLNRFF